MPTPGRLATVVLLPWTFALACGPSIGHDGYKSKTQQPWKSPTVLEWDEDYEAEVDDIVDYPKRKRARWYAVDLPSAGNLQIRLSVQTDDGGQREIDVAFEVLNGAYQVIERADRDEDDAFDLVKRRKLDSLRPGRYYLHVYAQDRVDRADFTLRALFESGTAAYESNFPADVPYVGILPAVPLFDDTPEQPEKPRVVRRPRTKAPAPQTALRGRISGITSTPTGVRIKIDRGESQGVAKGWRGTVVDKNGKAIENGRFTVDKVSSSEAYGFVKATQDAVTAAKYVRLSPP